MPPLDPSIVMTNGVVTTPLCVLGTSADAFPVT
jgi:hypothetical protein